MDGLTVTGEEWADGQRGRMKGRGEHLGRIKKAWVWDREWTF